MFRLKLCLSKRRLISACTQQQKVQLSTTNVASRRRRKKDDDMFQEATHPSDRYIRDFLEQTVKKDMKNLDSSIDYEASLLETARRRKLASEHAKEMKEINPKKDMTRTFTFKQMDQIKWLNFEDPQKWTYNNLARSFCSDPDTIRRIVQGSHQPNEEVRRLLDAQVLGKKRAISLYETEKMDHSTSSGKELDIFKPPTKEETTQQHVKKEDTFDTNKWFNNIKNAPTSKMKQQTYPTPLQLFNSLEDFCDEDQLDPDDLFAEDDHFEELFTHEDEEDRMEDDEEDFDESDMIDNDQVVDDQVKVEPLRIHTKDHVNFYDEKGRFLYKIG